MAGICRRISAAQHEQTTLAGLVQTQGEGVGDLVSVHQVLQGGGLAVLGIASKTHHAVNHVELLEAGGLVSDGAKHIATLQTVQVEGIFIDRTGDSANRIGIRQVASLVGVGEGTLSVSTAAHASAVSGEVAEETYW